MALREGRFTLMCWRACAQTVTKFAEDIRKAGGSAELFIYPGEGHAFMVRADFVPLHVRQASPLNEYSQRKSC